MLPERSWLPWRGRAGPGAARVPSGSTCSSVISHEVAGDDMCRISSAFCLSEAFLLESKVLNELGLRKSINHLMVKILSFFNYCFRQQKLFMQIIFFNPFYFSYYKSKFFCKQPKTWKYIAKK